MSDVATMTSFGATTVPARPASNVGPLGAAALLVAAGTMYLGREIGGRQASLFLVGVFAGLVLYHAAFGFTSSWRSFITGAFAAALAGKFAPAWRVSARSAAAAVAGGLLLGYGARIAYGCNIGAYFSGIASGSPHGWLWLVAAFIGNIAGTWLRPIFGLSR